MKRILKKPLFLIPAITIVLLITGVKVFGAVNKPYTVDGPSMSPTFNHGDVVTTRPFSSNDIKRGDVVIFKTSIAGSPKLLMKRIVGLPGDTVNVSDGVLTVTDSQGNIYRPYEGDVSGAVETTIAPGTIFVIGDNVANSLDSRNLGAIPFGDIQRVVKGSLKK